MKDSEVWAALVRWITLRSGITVIQSEQSGPRPALPYIVVNYLGSDETRDHPQDIQYLDEFLSGEPIVRAIPEIETEWRFSVHAYGASPTDILRPLRAGIHFSQINEPLMPSLIVHEVSMVRNLPEYVNETWEPRAQMDVNVRGLTRDGFQVDVIEEHTITFEKIVS